MSVRILIGDCREMLATLPDESVHCAVTSPPYWGLRCYGVDGQLGLEPSLGEHIGVMVEVFREVRRVLRKDGTAWLNYGDCYATSPNGRSAADTKAAGNDDRAFRDKPFSTVGPIYAEDIKARGRASGKESAWHGGNATAQGRICAGGLLKPKDLCMVPNRLAIALQEDGWWVRSEIIWAKPNPMPESITDRPTTAHEKIWLLSKSQRYLFDAEAVRETDQGRPSGNGFVREHRLSYSGRGQEDEWQPGGGRNLRNVWNIATAPFPEAHFATFPPALVEPCIKAGTSERGVCGDCGAPWVRQTVVTDRRVAGGSPAVPFEARGNFRFQQGHSQSDREGLTQSTKATTGWQPSCACEVAPIPATVLDPFGGAGTVGLVADRLGRDAVLIELNPDYAEMARRRIDQDAATRGQGPEPLMRGDDMPLFAEGS